MIWELWWIWIAAALVLGILETLAPGFVMLGFAVGALIVGLMVAAGFVPPLAWMLVIFAVVSLIAWLFFRRVVGVRKGQTKFFDTDINED